MNIRWTCPIIRVYWDEISNQISQIVRYLLPNDCLVILLGFSSRNGHTKRKWRINLLAASSCSATDSLSLENEK